MSFPFDGLSRLVTRQPLVRAAIEKLGLSRNLPVALFYDAIFRWPLSTVEMSTGTEPRRADYVVWYLIASGAITRDELLAPQRVLYADLARVHTSRYLESLSSGETLAMIFAVDASDIPVDETVNTIRIACGATLDAARAALRDRTSAVNMIGGFHHAFPDKGGGLCAVNDVAVATAVLRAEGFKGKVAILDLDAHPPDGTAACFAGQSEVWIGSLSGSFWKPLDGVDETLLPAACPDEKYLKALDALLCRMPHADLTYVLVGGDVLAGDRMGRLGLTLAGARRRDLMVAERLTGRPAVFLPAGGYHRDAWKVLAGTVLALKHRSKEPIPKRFDPMRAHYSEIWRALGIGALDDFELRPEDLDESLVCGPSQQRLLGAFTAENLELILERVGLLRHLSRLGFSGFRVEIDESSPGERFRLFGHFDGNEHVLIEAVVEKKRLEAIEVLYIHWMTLRNPRASFSEKRPALPGQEVPGLGLMREMGELFARMAKNLKLPAVAFRPAWYHMAYAARTYFQYLDPIRQGRFEAMLRDLHKMPLREVTLGVAQGRVRMNGQPYEWEPLEMAYWLNGRRQERRTVESERNRVHFTLIPLGGSHKKAERRGRLPG
ncbi:MAG: histone deacetylase [Myxococcales bacterium]|jgi:acetoin utilization deacetylase AcuC-like enzyme|nr:histone deacetylase [Myxococcales bacterium]